ncbi:MAG: hypothetical protein D3910_16165 [Candidatus Electrothrix sp. ATG2]|nr:hypothetical protein [Candidatus Electrothrix sp. ATG2]
MNSKISSVKVGDLVKVKPGVLDPDGLLVSDEGHRGRFLDHNIPEVLSLAGWQGKVRDIQPQEDGTTLIIIDWDSLTLQNMPKQAIRICKEKGLDWKQMALFPDDIDVIE